MIKSSIFGILISLFCLSQGLWWLYLVFQSNHSSMKMIFSEGLFFILVLIVLVFLFLRQLSAQSRMLQLRSFILQATAHELRSPLTSIRLAIESIDNPTRIQRVKEIIEEEVTRIDTFLYNVLEAIQKPHWPEEINDVQKTIAEWKENKTIPILISCPKFTNGVPKKILTLCLDQLLHNAIKARATEIKINYTPKGLEFTDNGSGIEMEYLKKIFSEKFSTTDSSGIGLFLQKKILSKYKINLTLVCLKNPTTFLLENLK